MTLLKKMEKAARILPKAQSTVADFVAKHSREVVFMTIEQLSRRVGVSTATVMRLAVNLGYSGFTDMINCLKKTFIEKEAPYNKFIQSLEQEQGAFPNLLELEQTLIKLTDLINDSNKITIAADMLFNARNVFFTGYRVSYVVATYLYQGICKIHDSCSLIQPNSVDLLEQIRRIGPGDVVFGCVFPRYYSLVPNILKSAQERGAKTILFSDGYNSPAAVNADILLPCHFETKSFHVSILGAVYLSDCIITSLSRIDPQRTMRMLNETEEIFLEYFKKQMR